MLAKNLNDNARFLNKRGACKFFASKLAPTKSVARRYILPSNNNTSRTTSTTPRIPDGP